MRLCSRAFALCAPVLLAGCSLGRPVPETTLFVIESDRGVARQAEPGLPETLRVGAVRVAAPFAGNSLVYRLGDVRYVTDPYNAFGADPGAMLGGRIAQWLDGAGAFRAVAQPGSARPSPYVLEVSVTELYGDFRSAKAPAAVLAMQFALIDHSGPRPTSSYERSYSHSVELPQASPEALVRGYGTALSQILAQVAVELSAQFHANGDQHVSPAP